MITRFRLGAAIAALVFAFIVGASFEGVSASGRPAASQSAAADVILKRFEINQGQFAAGVRFAARSKRDALLLMEDGAWLLGPAGTIDMRWGGQHADISPLDQLPGLTNYLRGTDSSRWRRNVRGYGRVRYAGVAPGIDLEFYSVRDGFEYDVRVAPGADLDGFGLRFGKATTPRVDAGGDLLIPVDRGTLRQRRPIAYQTIDGRRVPVQVRYEIRSGAVHLHAPAYDRTRELVVDPTLEFATYLGGSGNDGALATAVDGAGNVYVAGSTASADFPLAAAMMGDAGGTDAFVAKLTPDGSTLVYSTYLGGSGDDAANGLAVSSAGSVYLAGTTASTDFPLAAAMQSSAGAGTNAFVSRLDSTGSTLVFSTYLGGNGADVALGVATDAAGGAYVTGTTRSTDFPLLNAFQTSAGSGFVTKLTAAGGLAYSTYFGGAASAGNTGERAVTLRAISVDTAGAAYVAGETLGTSIPVTGGAFQTSPGVPFCRFLRASAPCSDALVAKLSPSGQLAYGTYLRETTAGWHDGATAIAVDGTGAAYVTGYTQSQQFPTTPGAYRQTCLTPSCGTFQDTFGTNTHSGEVFVTKVNPAGSGLVFSTLLGGTLGQAPTGIAVDKAGYATVAGRTASSDFAMVNAHQPVMGSAPLLRTSDGGATWTPLNGPPERILAKVAVAVDGTVYAMAHILGSEGVNAFYKSVNAGETWTRILDISTLATLSLDPNNANVVYANGRRSADAGATWTVMSGLPDGGTPDPIVRPGASNVLYSRRYPDDLFKSVDTGASWTQIGSGLPDTGPVGLTFLIAPSAPDTMYALDVLTLYASTDGGVTFSPRTLPAPLTRNVVVDPNNALTLYAGYPGGVRRSLDGGVTWQTTLSAPNVSIDGVAPTSPTTILASAEVQTNSAGPGTLYRSTDAGQTWTPVRPLRTGRQFAANPLTPTQGFEANVSAFPYTEGFVATISGDGSSLVYSSFIGGNADDDPRGVAVTADGAIVVGGSTASSNLPLTAGALQPSNAGESDAFLLKLRYPFPIFTLEAPANGTTQTTAFSLSGWTLDRGSTSGCGIDGIHVWAYPSGGAPMFITAAVPSVARPDVTALYGPQFSSCGFSIPIGNLPSGAYQFALVPHSSVTDTFAPARVLSATLTRQPFVFIDGPVAGATTYRGAKMRGWAADRLALTGTGVDAVHVWAFPNPGSGQAPIFAGVATLGVARPDVAAVIGSQFLNAGWELFLPASFAQGNYLFVASPHSTITGTFDPPATVQATVGDPMRMSIDVPANGATIPAGTNLGGWALDLASSSGPGIDAIHVWAFPNPGSGQAPVFAGVAAYGVPRGDIGAIYGSQFTNSGYNLNLSLAPGTYLLAVVPHSAVSGAFEAPRTLLVTIQ